MKYLGIDPHARQLTISVRGEDGDVLLARPGSTESDRVRAFFDHLTRDWLRDGKSFAAVLEVCGFNDWLIRMLTDYRCARVEEAPAPPAPRGPVTSLGPETGSQWPDARLESSVARAAGQPAVPTSAGERET